jgi:2-C-methyl-D-erythritol 4-phosphate cytidylyltransferase
MMADCPKQYLHIAGKSLLQHSVTAFLQHRQITHVFVVVSKDDAYVAQELQIDPRLTVLYCGGKIRSESVQNGLIAVQDRVDPVDWVLVHDAARPGLTPDLISRLISAVGLGEVGGILALSVTDTVKMRADGKKVTTLSRDGLWLAQTPQMFRHAPLLTAITNASNSDQKITDEANAMEIAGMNPQLVEGHWSNTKITRPEDLALIELFLKSADLPEVY